MGLKMGYQKSSVEMLVSAVNQNTVTLASEMNLEADAVIINQCQEDRYTEYLYQDHMIRCVYSRQKGVGRSRNLALLYAEAQLLLFADEDIRYRDGYAQDIRREFDQHPEADMILFNVRQSEGRETYHNNDFGRVRWYSCGRYPAYSICVRKKKLQEAGVMFSLLFGGGAQYSNGEDSLFLQECLRKKMRIYHSPIEIGHEIVRKSTWFEGYTDKFFIDRGVLYHFLYGRFASLFALRFLYKNRKTMCRERSLRKCYELMKKGMQSV